MRTKTGCPRALRFDGCGCACPYLHARSSELGKWLVASARNETSKEPTPWDRLLAHKDDDGRLLLSGLPYVDGLCVTPSEWKIESQPQEAEEAQAVDPRGEPRDHQRLPRGDHDGNQTDAGEN